MQDADATAGADAAAGASAEVGAAARVLLLDDDADTLEMMTFLLSRAGYRVTAVASASAARAALQHDRPDIVLLDVSLGGELLGLDIARAAREMERVVVILHTALSEDVVRLMFDRYDAFLRKPAPVGTLLKTLARLSI
jgi:DNA-binding response OmpR family regulator